MTNPILTTESPTTGEIAHHIEPIIEHGDSPTAIILATGFFAYLLLDSITRLIGVIGTMMHPSSSDHEKSDNKKNG